jgi:preprotein translocase subunit SecB
MSEQNAANPETRTLPVFRLQKIYIKDLSFENPNAPEVFFLQAPEPTVKMDLKMGNKKLDEDHYEVVLDISVTLTDKKSDRIMFIAEVEHAGAFLLQNIPADQLNQVLSIDCPTVLFPYTRQLVSQVSVDGGFMAYHMEPINFAALYESEKKKHQENQNG